VKYLHIFFNLLAFVFSQAQEPDSKELYQKIKKYYVLHPVGLEYIEHVHKNALNYDTIRNRFAYLQISENSYMMTWVDTTYSSSEGLFVADNNYFIIDNNLQKIRVRKKDLPGTLYSKIGIMPLYNSASLETTFGTIKSIIKTNKDYVALTTKYILNLDSSDFRIKKVIRYETYEGKIQYDEYNYIKLPARIEKALEKQIEDIVETTRDLPITNDKEIHKKEVQVKSFEGQAFEFKNLLSFNIGLLDSVIKNKYVILDFFYQTCLPCYKMTKLILEWLPSLDTSKIILIGIDHVDSENSLKRFTKERGITYPIIAGKQAMDIVTYYHITGYPTLFLLSPGGTIQNVHTGMSKSFLNKAEKIISR
jgi:thiol-disulfide isomerase/thioredoxin